MKSELIGLAKATAGELGFPRLKPAELIPLKLIPFNEAMTASDDLLKVSHIHFFIDDYQFERLWNSPERYLAVLKKARGVIGPDFSCFVNGPKAFNVWNVFRNRVLDNYLQANGIDVIPTLVLGDTESLSWAFDGLPKKATVAVGSVGSVKDPYYFTKGFETMMQKLRPKTVIVYGTIPGALKEKYAGQICEYTSFSQDRWRKPSPRRAETEKNKN